MIRNKLKRKVVGNGVCFQEVREMVSQELTVEKAHAQLWFLIAQLKMELAFCFSENVQISKIMTINQLKLKFILSLSL